MAAINWKVSKEDGKLITKIVDRALEIAAEANVEVKASTLNMDITACHANGTPLRLQELLDDQTGSFGHDVFGIWRHIDRTTGKLPEGIFHPRFAEKQ